MYFPKTYMEDSDLTIIRPLIYVSEAEVKRIPE